MTVFVRLSIDIKSQLCVFACVSAKIETLPFESRMNITAMALSPSGNILIAVNEGKCHNCSYIVIRLRCGNDIYTKCFGTARLKAALIARMMGRLCNQWSVKPHLKVNYS